MPKNSASQEEVIGTLHEVIIILLGVIDEFADVSDKTIRQRVAIAHHRELLEEVVKFFKNYTENPSKLKEILTKNWQKYKGTSCSFTATPDSEVTLLLCGVSKILGQWLGEKPIHLLMPGVSTESMVDGVPSLDDMDLKEVLKTHVLSESGNYLYPVSALSGLKCEDDLSSQQIPNPYFDYQRGPANEAYIPVSALERMLNHSPHTQAIMDAKATYQSLIKPTNLLGQLQLLIKILRMNSISGMGEEETAGKRVYAGIISFNDYYQTLNNEQKNAIPLDVKNKIELLLALSSNKEKNQEGTENLQTCTNILQSNLAVVTKEYEHILINIGVDGQTQSDLIKKAREAFVSRQKQLVEQCNTGNYTGEDRVTLTKKLILSLNIPVSVDSNADFQDFMSLTAQDIKSLLEDNVILQNQLIQKFNNLDALITFTMQAPIEQMKVILEIIAGKLPKPRNNEFSVWLEMLDLKRFEIVLRVFKDSVIFTGSDFGEILEHVEPLKRDIIYDEYVESLPALIQSAEDVDIALMLLSHEKRVTVYEKIKQKLPSLIKNGYEFGCVLEFLPDSQRDEVYEQMKDTIPDLIRNAEDLGFALQYLSTSQCQAVIDALKEKLNSLITSTKLLGIVLKYLKIESRAVVFEAMQGRFSWLIRNPKNLKEALEFLNVEQCKVVLEKIEHRLSKLIYSTKHIQQALALLSAEQCEVVIDAIKETLPKIIQVSSDISEVLSGLGEQQSKVVLTAIKKKLRSLIQSPYALGSILKKLDILQIQVLLGVLKERLHRLIQNPNDLKRVIENLSVEQRTTVLAELKDKLPSLSRPEYVNEYLANLTPASSKIVLEVILPVLIQSATNYNQMMTYLDNHWRDVVYEMIKHRLPVLMQTADDVSAIFGTLSVAQRQTQFDAIKDKFPNLILNAHDIGQACRYLDEQQFTLVFARIVDRLVSLVQTADDVSKALMPLTTNNRAVAFEAVKCRLPSMIKTSDDAHKVLMHLTNKQCKDVLKAIKDKLPTLFKTAKDVDNFMLNHENLALVKKAWNKAQVGYRLADNPPTFLPHKRLIEEKGLTAKRIKQTVASREVAYLERSAALEASRERRRQERAAVPKLCVNREVAYLQQSAALEESRERRRKERAANRLNM